MMYAKGGVLSGGADYTAEPGERIISLKEMQRVMEIRKEQCEKYEEGGLCRNFWTPAHAETMMYFRLELTAYNIAWEDDTDEMMIRTKFKLNADDREDWSVICGKYSMGGTDGLLEVWNPADDEPSGGYTIDEIVDMIARKKQTMDKNTALSVLIDLRQIKIKQGMVRIAEALDFAIEALEETMSACYLAYKGAREQLQQEDEE